MYDYTFTINLVSFGTAIDVMLVLLLFFIVYWVIKFLWSIVVGG